MQVQGPTGQYPKLQEKLQRPAKLPDWPAALVPPLQLVGSAGGALLVREAGGGELGGGELLVGLAGGVTGEEGLVPREG